MRAVVFSALLICYSVAVKAEFPHVEPLAVKYGTNVFVDTSGDGKPVTIVKMWRENGNAWGVHFYAVVAGGSLVPHESDTQNPDFLIDSPHTGEDAIKAIRFTRARWNPRKSLYVYIANRDVKGPIPSPASTNFIMYRLMRSDEPIGPPYVLKKIWEHPASHLYCSADVALKVELGLPLPKGYTGPDNKDGCFPEDRVKAK